MGAKVNFRGRVMKYAWQLRKTTSDTFRNCLKRAWQLWKLAKAMRQGIAVFYYTKADGSIRKAFGTLRNLPIGVSAGGKKMTKPSYKTMSYYDIEKKAFRSFKIENLISVA